MQEGSLRVDANINLHIDTPEGHVATPIVEVKNMNSFRAVERALAYEAERQYEVWQETGNRAGRRAQADPGLGRRRPGHPAAAVEGRIERLSLLPRPRPRAGHDDRRAGRADSRSRWANCPPRCGRGSRRTYGITPYDADVLVNQGRAVVDYYVELADRSGDGKMAANWVQQDVLRTLNERQITIDAFAVSAPSLAELLGKVQAGRLTTSRGREVLAEMLASGTSVEAAMKAMGIEEVDQSDLETLCRELLAANPKIVQDVKEGRIKAAASLIGQAKKRNPNVNPGQVRDLCLQLIEKM